MARVPLAWRNLTSDTSKFLLSVLAISFAVMLLFVQLGFYNALLDSSILLIERFNADLILVHKGRNYISYPQGFPRDALFRLRSTPGVESTHPLTIEVTLPQLLDPAHRSGSFPPGTQNQPAPNRRLIRVIAVDPNAEILDLPELSLKGPNSLVAALRVPGQAIIDTESKPQFGILDESRRLKGDQVVTELAGQQVRVIGTFTLGLDFGNDGNLIVSEDTFRDYLRAPFPFLQPDYIDFGLIRVKRENGRPVEPLLTIKDRLNAQLENTTLEVMTRSELMLKEQRFWLNSTPIGQVFNVGLFMGIVVGALICYQILSSGVADRLTEYATLRAIGYSNWYLAGVVCQEAFYLATLGFLPGWGAAYLVYQGLEWATNLPLRFTWDRVLMVFVASLVMCAISALFAVREAQGVDPAEVF